MRHLLVTPALRAQQMTDLDRLAQRTDVQLGIAPQRLAVGDKVLSSATGIDVMIADRWTLPPLVEGGDLFVDGAIFNNFPVDVMRRTRGVGVVLGV